MCRRLQIAITTLNRLYIYAGWLASTASRNPKCSGLVVSSVSHQFNVIMRFVAATLLLAFFVSLPGESSELTTVSVPDIIDPYNEEVLRFYWTLRYLEYLEYLRGQNQLGNRFGDENSTTKPAVNTSTNYGNSSPPEVTEQPKCKQIGDRVSTNLAPLYFLISH